MERGEKKFRIDPKRPCIVQGWWKGGWIDARYCKDEEAAKISLVRCIERHLAFSNMTQDERMKAILRIR